MIFVPLPTSAQPFLTQSTSLEDQSYKITFDWNSRSGRWMMDISTEDGDSVLSGAALVIGVDLLRTVPSTLATAPPGNLILVGLDDPTLETIDTVSLVYVPSE